MHMGIDERRCHQRAAEADHPVGRVQVCLGCAFTADPRDSVANDQHRRGERVSRAVDDSLAQENRLRHGDSLPAGLAT